MRSAVYRTGLLRSFRPQTCVQLQARPLSSSTYDDKPPPTFPLYRPPPTAQSPYESHPHRSTYIDPNSLPSDRKIRKATKIQLTEKAIQDLPELEEDDLRSFYAAVMESGRTLESDAPQIEDGQRMSIEEQTRVIENLAVRLIGTEAGPSKLPTVHSGLREKVVSDIVQKLRTIQVPATEEEGRRVPLGLVSRTEWGVLLEETAARDGREAESLMDLMSVHGTYPDQNQVTQVMGSYAREGRVEDVVRIYTLLKQSGIQATDAQSDLLIEAHLRHSSPQIYPAINLMQALATAGEPLAQSSYNILLNHLTITQSTAQTRSLAWDLFANMRLTAYASPTAAIYSTMISACASSKDPQPERARDLWIELNESTSPERREYDAIIKALSSTKSTYLEAFDLFRQMLAKHTEATFIPFDESTNSDMERWSRFIPTAETFNALLEGTKRAGDLNRARWVLNEVVKLQSGAKGWKGVNEELMSGVFMTYASWKPVIKRQLVKWTAPSAGRAVAGLATQTDETEMYSTDRVSGTSSVSQAADSVPDFDLDHLRDHPESVMEPSAQTHHSPQTSADAIREAEVLFQQIIQDTRPEAAGPFTNVRLTTRLINSYLSVHLAHAPSIASARQAWDETWSMASERGVKMNGWSMMQVLERCAAGEQGRDRDEATVWAKIVWEDYLVFTQEHLDYSSAEQTQKIYTIGLGPRQIERCYRSIIRALSLSPSIPIEEPIALLNTFHTLYPPSTILDGYSATPPTPFQIRMTDRTRLAESDIPPNILFGDIDVLHQRLVREGRKELGWLKWVCKSYEVALRKRRKWRLKGRGEEGRTRRRSNRIGVSVQEVSEGDQVSDEEYERWEAHQSGDQQ